MFLKLEEVYEGLGGIVIIPQNHGVCDFFLGHHDVWRAFPSSLSCCTSLLMCLLYVWSFSLWRVVMAYG